MKGILVGRIKEHVELQSAILKTYAQLKAEVMKYATQKRLDRNILQYKGDDGRMLDNVDPLGRREEGTGGEEMELQGRRRMRE